jgi:uncharacterized phage protein (TIGR02220 family)
MGTPLRNHAETSAGVYHAQRMKPDGKGPWVALYRKTGSSDTFLSLSCAERSIFLQSLFLAAGTEYDCLYHGRTYRLLPGQFVTTLDDLAKKCGRGCSIKMVRRTLDKLKEAQTWADNRVSKRADAPHLVAFSNWASYQLGYGHRADERADDRHTLGQDECQQTLSGIEDFSSNNVLERIRTKDKDTDCGVLPTLATPDGTEEVMAYLNEKMHTKLREPHDLPARLKDGYTVEDCKKVIDIKYAEWHGGEHEKYIRPSTLFRKGHFDEYLNQSTVIKDTFLHFIEGKSDLDWHLLPESDQYARSCRLLLAFKEAENSGKVAFTKQDYDMRQIALGIKSDETHILIRGGGR